MKSLTQMFKRQPKVLDSRPLEEKDGVEFEPSFEDNNKALHKQRIILGSTAVVALVAGSWYIMKDDSAAPVDPNGSSTTQVSASDLVNRNMSQQEWMAMSEQRMQSIDNQLRGVEGQRAQMEALQQQLASGQVERQSMATDGQRVVSAYQTENEQLRAALQAAQRAQAPAPVGPSALYGAGAPGTYGANGPPTPANAAALAAAAAASAPSPSRSIRMVSFTEGQSGNATRIAGGSTSYTDSPNYLPPNSIAPATVIVGVDASAGTNSQTDPLPVVLRITGPARSVYRNGRLMRTNISGCLVNGAARGDLSSEKVYIRLQRMTCPQQNGRFAVSDVRGFVAFGGQTGVRGRVVSREGSLVSQAFLAGLVGGIGRGFGANATSALTAPNISVGGQRDQLSTRDIIQGGVGQGVSQAGDMVSQYLIERAEQYQPVIEMPTGISVEIVFLDGVFIQN